MAKKTGLQQYHALSKQYEKKTGKKPVGMKLEDLKEYFKKSRKKKTKSSTKSTGGASGNGVAEIFAQDW